MYFTKVFQELCSQKYLFWLSLGKKMPDFKILDNSVNQQVRLIGIIEGMELRIEQ
jgi:hypothetical protein